MSSGSRSALAVRIVTCAHCGALIVATPSGGVCSRGCGRILPRPGRGRLVVELLLAAGIDRLPRARRYRGTYRVDGNQVRYRRITDWPRCRAAAIVDAVRGGLTPALYYDRLVVLEPLPLQRRRKPKRLPAAPRGAQDKGE